MPYCNTCKKIYNQCENCGGIIKTESQCNEKNCFLFGDFLCNSCTNRMCTKHYVYRDNKLWCLNCSK